MKYWVTLMALCSYDLGEVSMSDEVMGDTNGTVEL